AGPGEGPPSSTPAAPTATKRWTRPFRLRLTRGWAWALAGAAAVAAALRAPTVSADVRTMIGPGLHLAWLGAVAAAAIPSLAGLMVAQRPLLSPAGGRESRAALARGA